MTRAPSGASAVPVMRIGDRGAARGPWGATRPTFRHAFAALAAACLVALAGCASLPKEYPRADSHAWPHPEATPIGRAFADRLAAHPGLSAVRLLPSGIDAFAARVGLVEAAERTLDLQYYMVRGDESTLALMSRVVAAADRGVRVRLLVDDLYAAGRDFDVAALARHPHMEVRVFNPFLRRGPSGFARALEWLGDTERLNHRMHNKLFVADNAAAILGGRNLGNEYFGAEADTGFVDLDLLAVGPVVQQASRSFDDYWDSEWSIPVEAFVTSLPTEEDADRVLRRLRAVETDVRESEFGTRLRASELVARYRSGSVDFEWARARAIYDPPEKVQGTGSREFQIRPQLRALADAIRSEAVIVSPYFIPGDGGVAFLAGLRDRGVSVRVLTNSLAATDVPSVYAGYAKYVLPLLRSGVELYELRPVGGNAASQERIEHGLGASRAALHAKAFVVDRRYVFVGSMNLDPRSDLLNTEIGVLIDSEDVAHDILAMFARLTSPVASYRRVIDDGEAAWITQSEGREVRTRVAPDTSAWRRFLAGVLSMIAPEDML